MSNHLNYNVHIFYYPWYGAPPTSPQWVHWNSGGPGVLDHNPAKEDITSNYYPVLGPYDSCDPKVLDHHMKWISSSGVGTIISSWRGKGSFEDHCVLKIMDAADQHLLKVGFHLEPYENRTAQSVVNDINYIEERYGRHSAYLRDPNHGNRSVFYVYRVAAIEDWSSIQTLKNKTIILAQTVDQTKYVHFSGFYSYAIGNSNSVVEEWKKMNNFCKEKSLIWSPSIGPGFIDRVAKPNSNTTIFDRQNGSMYDNNWNFVFDSGVPNWVSITSFNEWHQGSSIEPASSHPPLDRYLTYSGAFGKTDVAAETAYLERTAYWVQEFNKRQKV